MAILASIASAMAIIQTILPWFLLLLLFFIFPFCGQTTYKFGLTSGSSFFLLMINLEPLRIGLLAGVIHRKRYPLWPQGAGLRNEA